MAYARPTLSELVERVEKDFVSRLRLAGALLRRAVVPVFARVVAGAAHMMHGHIAYSANQIFADSCDDENLVRLAGLRGMSKTPPTFAQATATVTGTNGTVIRADTRLLRSDSIPYLVDADVTISGGTGTVALTAEVVGSDSTLSTDTVLSFESPIPGIDSTATVVASTFDGTDEETTEALRVRYIERLREPAHGGTDADYEEWTKEVSGATRAWVTPRGLGPGTVVVRFVRDNDVSPIPDSGEVAAVQAKLDANRPAHAAVTAVAPVAAPVNFTLHIVPDSTETRAAVQAELVDLLFRDARPGGTLLLSTIRTAIGNAAGLTDYSLASPSANVTNTSNQFPTLGTLTWT